MPATASTRPFAPASFRRCAAALAALAVLALATFAARAAESAAPAPSPATTATPPVAVGTTTTSTPAAATTPVASAAPTAVPPTTALTPPAAAATTTSAAAAQPDPNHPNFPYIGRSNPDGYPVRFARTTGHITNYDEARVRPYTLPDPLTLANGQPVTDAATWLNRRRPELLQFYTTEFFGRVPATAPSVTFEVTRTDPTALNGTAILKTLTGHLGGPSGPAIRLLLLLPAKTASTSGSVPVVLSLSFSAPPNIPTGPAAATAAPRTGDPYTEILAHGYGYATLCYTDIEHDAATDNLTLARRLALAPGQTTLAADEWGTISAWAWGVSRVLDYLATDPDVDAHHVALYGHSRLGKAALWAGAQDPRIALVFASCAGELGSALTRRDWGETLDDMTEKFPYWFAANLQKYAGHWDALPVDAHLLIALNAPRPVFITGGTTDQWSDPKGQFLAEIAAGPVYRLLGRRDLGLTAMPALDTPVITGDLGAYYHTGGHATPLPDWRAFLAFADKYFHPAAPAKN